MSANAGIHPGHVVASSPNPPAPFAPGDPLFNVVNTAVPYQALVGDLVVTSDASVTTPVAPSSGDYFAVKNIGASSISIIGTVDGIMTYAIAPAVSPAAQFALWFVWNAAVATWELVSHDPSPLPIFTNCAALSAFPDAGLPDKTEVRVQSVRDYFALDTTSTATLAQAVVLATQSGTGRWIRQNRFDPRWLMQANWFVSAATGNDENAGSTSGTPLRTPQELARRIGNNTWQTVSQFTTITILDNLPNTTPLQLRVTLGGDGLATGATRMVIKGTPVVLTTGAVTTYTALLRTAVQPTNTMVAAVTWANFIGKWIRMTSGVGNGYSAVITKDLGANTARLSPFVAPVTPTSAAPPAAPAQQPAIVPGDTFEIIEKTSVGGLQLSFRSTPIDGTTSNVNLTVQVHDIKNTKLSGNAAFSGSYFEIQDNGLAGYVYGCDVGGLSWGGNIARAVNCRGSAGAVSAISFTSGGGVRWLGGAFCGDTSGADIILQITGCANVIMDGDVVLQDVLLQIGTSTAQSFAYRSALTIGLACLLDSGGGGDGTSCLVCCGAVVNQRTVSYGTNLFYGTNNTGYGIRVISNGAYVYSVNKPTVNAGLGVGRETMIGGVDTLYAAVPAVTAANGAMIVAEA